MLKAINLEFFKMRRRKFILPIVLITFVGILWSSAISIKELKLTDTKYGIYMLTSNILTVDSMIYPILIGILCSRLADIEHKGKTFQLLNTSKQSVFNLFSSKVIVSLIILFVIDIIQLINISIIASLNNINLNLAIVSKFILSFIIASFLLILIHMALSFFFEKQSISIVLALVGSFLGLVTGGMLPSYIKVFLPWQYYSLLNPVHKKMIHKGFEYSYNTYYLIYIFVSVIIIVILFLVIKLLLKRRDLT
ncbi:ABC transporter permease [Staphylococcus sp. SQ8-PEA]|uniref:ABC transporter permease n=1 Tax=Staphylococcus marylandisciuri TaxID=2981529 RepID=A0ABT2QR65_9STAP|nr:ABC transporter permease [Staphylococcus marylandisciuri]MCU5746470.1 ABC transporter permease [Staphylococcus marylandisciuri]